MIGTLNLIKNQDHSSTIKQLLETLNGSVSKLEEYTNKALLFSQLSRKKYSHRFNPLNLRELAQFAVLELNSRLRENRIDVDVQPLKNTLFINADRDLIFKAFVYILDNAIDNSSLKGKIEINFQEEGGNIICSITDMGPGFSVEQLNKLLHPLQFEGDKNYQKTGLSLMIVKLIMDLHESKLNIFNKDVAGACVELIFNK
jgi:K+-sensing histidine kinase KdpD